LRDGVILEAEVREEPDGIVLPENYRDKKKNQIGFVVRCGCDCKEVKKGDKVILPEYGGTEVKFGNRKYRIVRESEITAKVES